MRQRLHQSVLKNSSCLHWTYSRNGGPGGQNVNKSNSKCTLRIANHDLYKIIESILTDGSNEYGIAIEMVNPKDSSSVDLASHSSMIQQQVMKVIETEQAGRCTRDNDLIIIADNMRSQAENRQLCLDKLTEIIGDAITTVKEANATATAEKKQRIAGLLAAFNQHRLASKKIDSMKRTLRNQAKTPWKQ